MKIGLMGGWNTDSGASLHSELIGRAWVEEGIKLTVFTFYKESFHGTQITGEDEEFVIRCFTTSRAEPQRLNPIPFLTEDYNVFVVEDLGMLPKDHLGKIFHRIKKKAITVNIIHDGKLTDDPSFYQFDWDAIVCFDERYRDFLKEAYDEERIHIIPYPCHEQKIIDKTSARRGLSLPQDKKILFTFGPASYYTLSLVEDIFSFKEFILLVVTKHQNSLTGFYPLQERYPIIIREEAPDINRLYEYLNSADGLIFNKPSARWVVVSSTVFQCLGSGCPIIAYASNFIETLKDEVLRYHNRDEFLNCLRIVIEGGDRYQQVRERGLAYVQRNSARNVARRYLQLFEDLLKRRRNA
ncbi:hypothetical protein DRP53_09240 [candidate division WOR-3 bacterium]|uniref:Glycosyltransferase family 1 protein n=1 Tax=candidate division WOR-3 bacterium TaxID=2052148 RepID=A0A660SFZ9_UNCW3|nr:MAG: hypothetical protein DRP53_09240 [candidate division WOR-3 bacterium]